MELLSRRQVLGAAGLATVGGLWLPAQGAEDRDEPIAGAWTYRSFLNDPDPNLPFNDLQFAVADLTFDKARFGQIKGRLQFGQDYLNLKGTITYGNPFTLRFEGVGATPGTIEQGQPWVYDYLGFLAPAWPNGVNQRPAIVGTIVRTVAHSQGRAKAGVVASWIAVRKDQDTPPADDPNARLTQLERDWAAAVTTNKPAEIGRYLTSDFFFVGASGVLQSRAEHLDDFKTEKLKVKAVDVKDVKLSVAVSGAAVNTLAGVAGQYNGRDISGDYRFMDTWLYQGKQWLAVARQQTRVG
jgi:hypothetical protein